MEPSSPAPVPKIVVFDTNAYRGLVHRRTPEAAKLRAQRLKAAENARGIRAFTNPFVIVELLSHLADLSDPWFADCLGGTLALRDHCRLETPVNTVATMADPESLLAHALFGVRWPDGEHNLQMLIGLVETIYQSPHDVLPRLAEPLVSIAEANAAQEKTFAVLMQASFHGIDLTDPEVRRELNADLRGEEGRKLAAAVTVLRIGQYVGQSGVESETWQRAAWVARQFPAATWLHAEKLRQMAIDGLDIWKHRNSVWDIDAAFAISQQVEGEKVTLVTTETDFHRAAAAVGQAEYVLSLDTYLRLLDLA